jgi:branched-chain amino acid transport system permease protein
VLVTTAAGTAVGALTFVPGLSRLSNANMLMLTAGLLTLTEGALLLLWGSQPYALNSFTGDQPLNIGGILVPTQGLWVMGTACLIILGLWYLLSRTFLGQALRA